MAAFNEFDLILQADTVRIEGVPSAVPVPLSITQVTNTDGSFDITLNWSYTQGFIKATELCLIWNFNLSTPPGAPTVASNMGMIRLPADAKTFTFKGAPPDYYQRAGIFARQVVDGLTFDTAVISPISAPDWRTVPGVGMIDGTPIADISTGIATALAMSDDSKIDPAEKKILRADWDWMVTDRSLIIAQAAAFGVSSTAFTTAFQNLANLWNSGAGVWVSGVPFNLQDAQMGVINPIAGSVWRPLLQAYNDERTNVLNAISSSAATTAAWTGVSAKPGNIYSSDDAARYGLNSTFNNWTGAATGTAPDGWALAGSAAAQISRDSITALGGGNSVKFICNGSDSYITKDFISSTVGYSAKTVVTGSLSIYMTARTAGLPGIIIGFYNSAGGFIAQAIAQPSATTLNQWHTIPFICRGNGTTPIAKISIFVVGSLTSMPSGAFTGTCFIGGFSLNINDGIIDNQQQTFAQITADQINTAAQILNGSISATKTAIAAINPSTGNLAASQVTAIQAMFGTLSALNANLGTVTAGSITGTAGINISGQAVFNGNFTTTTGITAALAANLGASAAVGIAVRGSGTGVTSRATGTGGWGLEGQSVSATGYGVIGINTAGGVGVYCDGRFAITSNLLVNNLNASFVNGFKLNSSTTGAGTASFPGNNKPGGASTNTWMPVTNTAGTTIGYIPIWT